MTHSVERDEVTDEFYRQAGVDPDEANSAKYAFAYAKVQQKLLDMVRAGGDPKSLRVETVNGSPRVAMEMAS
ncbi:hypothetical protein OEG84_11685 [Hoeflea sp. G2-23]|uniref:Uncharacterized protein n=1 Tax=Hoeflea algicola TaxID=2983763 RepID=A0ABT3Z9L2_9HYPH|nr:hypothetical protein [Hoeflea algicola]MCY0148353.1 hypothetical protein [Hoeflea algicola]